MEAKTLQTSDATGVTNGGSVGTAVTSLQEFTREAAKARHFNVAAFIRNASQNLRYRQNNMILRRGVYFFHRRFPTPKDQSFLLLVWNYYCVGFVPIRNSASPNLLQIIFHIPNHVSCRGRRKSKFHQLKCESRSLQFVF